MKRQAFPKDKPGIYDPSASDNDGDEENDDDGVALSVLKWSNELFYVTSCSWIMTLTPATWIDRLECFRTANSWHGESKWTEHLFTAPGLCWFVGTSYDLMWHGK